MMSSRAQAVLALTLATGPLLIASTAHAATPCGQPAQAAVHQSVHHDAVTHLEWRWALTVVDVAAAGASDEPATVVPSTWKTVEVVDRAALDETVVDSAAHDETVVDSAAYDETVVDSAAHDETVVDHAAYDETVVDHAAYDETIVDHAAYDVTVVDQPAKDAVYQTLARWVHKTTGAVRWEPVDWNGNSVTTSWLVTSDTMVGDLVSAAVAAVTHVEHHDAVTHVVHHPAVTHVVHHDAVTHVVHHDAVTHVVHHDAVTHDETVVDVPGHTVAGAHHDAVAEVSHLEYTWSVDSPGTGWTQTAQSRLVVDQPAYESQQLVSAAVPATAACAAIPSGTAAQDEPAGPAASPASASDVPATLAFTGADTGTYVAGGLVLVFLGAGLIAAGRRQETSD
jgi:hypothetical protein